MELCESPAAVELAAELRAYFARLMTPDRLAALDTADGEYGSGDVYRDTVRQLGTDGWLAVGWPVEYGGQGRSTADQLVFADEAARARAPIPFLTLNSVAPTIMAYGSPEQKADLLPRIAAGQLHFSIGYSEPDAGTDLASLRTRADRDGDEYVINGQKMWTSLIQYADYVWLACRTDPEARKHKGLSMLVVPTDAPGFSWTPVRTMAGVTTSATYYQDVRVPVSARIGEENTGWSLITNQLNHERISLTSSMPLRVALLEVTEWARTTQAENGRPVLDSERVQMSLARVHAGVEVLRLMNARSAWTADQGLPLGVADASATKVYATEMAVELYRLLMDVVGPAGVIRKDAPGAVLAGRLERMHRASLVLTFGGGTNEVQRDMIAAAGLNQPIGEAMMDFSVTAEQQELTALTRKIVDDLVDPAALRAAEQTGHPDQKLWRALADAGVIAAATPRLSTVGSSAGSTAGSTGEGLGVQEQCAVLTELGRAVAPVPLRATTVAGAMLARFGNPQQQARWLEPALAGDLVLAAAPALTGLRTPATSDSLTAVPLTAGPGEEPGWELDGTYDLLAAGTSAGAVVVEARTPAGSAVFVIEVADPGVAVIPQSTVDGPGTARLELHGVRLSPDRLLDGDTTGRLLALATLAACAEQVGVLAGGLEITAEYARTREQFGRPIGAFQAVSQRLADAWIDVESLRLTTWNAAWALDAGLEAEPDAAMAVSTAKFWAAEAGHRVAHTLVHVHGGAGLDLDNGIHRHFTAAKRLEFELGTASTQLTRLGRLLAGA